MEHLSIDHENSRHLHKMLCDEKEHSPLRWRKSEWELRQQYDQNFPMEGKPL